MGRCSMIHRMPLSGWSTGFASSGFTAHLPFKVKVRSGRKMLVKDGKPSLALIAAVANGHRWLELIEMGFYTSITALAKALGKDRGYVRRIIRLAFLAPDIVEAILEGKEPEGIVIDRLAELPVSWEEQRKALGMQTAP